MGLLLQELRSRLQYKIIIPFLMLTLCVALVGSAVVFSLVAGSLQERFNNQLATVTRAASDGIVAQEQANLQFLREVAFAGRNEASGAPGVPEALAGGDSAGLAQALDPYFRVAARRANVRVDRLIAFDQTGTSVVDLERDPQAPAGEYITNPPLDLNGVWFTRRVLTATSDERGDKFAGLIRFTDTQALYFATAAPVRQGDEVVGGVVAAMRVDSLLVSLVARSQAAAINLYDQDGKLLATTFPGQSPGDMEAELYAEFLETPDTASRSVYHTVRIDGREYQAAFVPLVVRGVSVGILAPALSRDYVVGAWSDARIPIIVVFVTLMALIVGLGVYIARIITAPLEELVLTARAVTAGQLNRRSQVRSRDELGLLATSFNTMTEYLIDLLGRVRAESGQRAAIVESIADGIVVVDEEGRVQLVNRATRQLLDLGDDDPAPTRLDDIPLQPLTEGVPGFGSKRVQDLYTLGAHIVRVSIAPVTTEDGSKLGYVCVLQDMTSDVAVDRAKTNFIGTISHELRTPLTVIRGNADLLMRGLAGPLDEDQKKFIDTIRQHAGNMTSLLTNVITIAGLDSGSLTTTLEPMDLMRPIDEAAWQVRAQVKAKGLALDIELPRDCPQVMADFEQLRMVIFQLLDNARRYTAEGRILVRAVCREHDVVVEVQDTGRGIGADQQLHVFERFTRGDGASEGINSSERGIGLGLAIAKQLIERQGGTIWVTSEPGQGSTFSFTLRYANDTSSPENSSSSLAAAA